MNQKKLRQHARKIFMSAIKAVNPELVVKRSLRYESNNLHVAGHTFDLKQIHRVLLIGAGKAAAAMARGVELRLGNRIEQGIIITQYGQGRHLQFTKILEAGHPEPDHRGILAAMKILSLVQSATANDLIICLISGGGSALLPLPADGLTLEDKTKVTSTLLSHGVPIHEINKVRKHISRIKGGQLARVAHPAYMATLILSDVVGDPVDVIASGPTVADPSTFADAKNILHFYDIWPELPAAVKEHISAGCAGKIEETPKPGDAIFERCFTSIVASNKNALEQSQLYASQKLGYSTMILANCIQGEACETGRFYSSILQSMIQGHYPFKPSACILAGGETTVTIRNPNGKGGRNQEMALSVALAIEGLENCLFLSGGTDGKDGPTEAAGAFADGNSVSRARIHKLEPAFSYLENNDSYTFFKSIDDLLITGPTQTNVMDLQILLTC